LATSVSLEISQIRVAKERSLNNKNTR